MKLPSRLTRPSDSDSLLQWALWWAAQGWLVFPCVPGQKEPATPRGYKDGTNDPVQVKRWWTTKPDYNIGATPPAGWVALDGDPRHNNGVDPLADWPSTRTHLSGRGDGGKHLFYADPEGRVPQAQPLLPGIDSRVSGKGYVILPPSVHPDSGEPYTIGSDVDPVMFPYERLDKKAPGDMSQKATESSEDTSLVGELQKLPGESGDDLGDAWLLRVAGQLATLQNRLLKQKEFEAILRVVNQARADPQPDAHVGKKVAGTWDKEATKKRFANEEANGWLLEAGDYGYTSQIDGGDGKLKLVPWSDFRVKVLGVIDHGDRQIWLIDLLLPDGSVREKQLLPSSVLSSTARLRQWFMDRGCTLYTDRRDTRGVPGERLLKLMQSQSPRTLPAVDYYGWHSDIKCFVGPDGVLVGDEWVHPDPKLRDAQVNYGLEVDEAEAVSVLRRVLTFQSEESAAVMGSWLMMLILKGQYRGALLPGLVVQGLAGSGKTEFSRMIVMLSGAKSQGGHLTAAAMKNRMPMSANSALWIDDCEVSEQIQAIIRVALTDGVYLDQGGEGRTAREFPLRSGIVVSNEGMGGYLSQKANLDRVIVVDLPFAEDRKSLIDPLRPQWDDVQDLLNQFDGDLTRVAGSLVKVVLAHSEELGLLADKLESTSRSKQAEAVILAGSRILSRVTGDNRWEPLVQQWVNRRIDYGKASEVVLNVMPHIWADLGNPTSADHLQAMYRDSETGRFWVNARKLAVAWRAHPMSRDGGHRTAALTTPEAVTRELTSCGCGPSKTQGPDREHKLRYRELPDQYSQMVYERALGID